MFHNADEALHNRMKAVAVLPACSLDRVTLQRTADNIGATDTEVLA